MGVQFLEGSGFAFCWDFICDLPRHVKTEVANVFHLPKLCDVGGSGNGNWYARELIVGGNGMATGDDT